MTDKFKLAKFKNILEEEGEMFFSSGSDKTDLQNIERTLEAQGYWAGVKYRYYFTDNFDLEKVEERKWGLNG